MKKKFVLLTVLLAACLVVSGCGPSAEQQATMTAAAWTATPTQTATPTLSPTLTASPTATPTAINFDYDAILEKLLLILNVSSDKDAFIQPIKQYESILLGEFIVPAPLDSEGGPWLIYFIATQNGSEVTVALERTEAFTEGLERLYAAGLISQDFFYMLAWTPSPTPYP